MTPEYPQQIGCIIGGRGFSFCTALVTKGRDTGCLGPMPDQSLTGGLKCLMA